MLIRSNWGPRSTWGRTSTLRLAALGRRVVVVLHPTTSACRWCHGGWTTTRRAYWRRWWRWWRRWRRWWRWRVPDWRWDWWTRIDRSLLLLSGCWRWLWCLFSRRWLAARWGLGWHRCYCSLGVDWHFVQRRTTHRPSSRLYAQHRQSHNRFKSLGRRKWTSFLATKRAKSVRTPIPLFDQCHPYITILSMMVLVEAGDTRSVGKCLRSVRLHVASRIPDNLAKLPRS